MTDPSEQQPRSSASTGKVRDSHAQATSCRLPSPAWVARVSGVWLSATAVIFSLGLLLLLENGGELALITRPLPVRMILLLPYLVALFALGTAISIPIAWRQSYWSRGVRIHQTLLAILGLGFTWQLFEHGFLAI